MLGFGIYVLSTDVNQAEFREAVAKGSELMVPVPMDPEVAKSLAHVPEMLTPKEEPAAPSLAGNNLEAAKEVAYQVKLRGIGGIIIVDFIDMEREKNRDKVYHALVDAMASDKARTRISRISDLGLIEISRERVREDLLRSLSEPCRYCEGRGYTKSPTTVAYEIFREIRKIGSGAEQQRIVVGAHPSVAGLLQDEERQGLEALERECAAKVHVMPDEQLHLEQYDLVVM